MTKRVVVRMGRDGRPAPVSRPSEHVDLAIDHPLGRRIILALTAILLLATLASLLKGRGATGRGSGGRTALGDGGLRGVASAFGFVMLLLGGALLGLMGRFREP